MIRYALDVEGSGTAKAHTLGKTALRDRICSDADERLSAAVLTYTNPILP